MANDLTIDQLRETLVKADAAAQRGEPGAADDAKHLARHISDMQAQSNDGEYKPAGAGMTFAHQLANSASFGGLDYARALVRSHARGTKYTDEVANLHRESEADTVENPKASWGGWGAGMVAGGGGLALAGRAAAKAGSAAVRNTAGWALTPGETAGANAAKAATVGGVVGAGTGAAETGGDVGETIKGAAVGAGAGVAVGHAAAKLEPYVSDAVRSVANSSITKRAADMLAPISDKVAPMVEAAKARFGTDNMALIAKRLKVDPDELTQAAIGFESEYGRRPAMTDILNGHKQGMLQDWAKKAPVMANALAEEQSARALAAPMSLRETLQDIHGKDLHTSASLLQEQAAAMDRSMDALRTRTGFMPREEIEAVIRNRGNLGLKGGKGVVLESEEQSLSGRLDQAQELLADRRVAGLNVPLTDVEHLRRKAGKFGERQYTKGTNEEYEIARAFKNGLVERGEAIAPGYKKALDTFSGHSKRQEAFDVAMQGHTREEAPKKLYDYTRTTSSEGNIGYREGVLAKLADDADAPAKALRTARNILEDVKLGNELGKTLSPNELQQLRTHAKYIIETNESAGKVNPGRTTEVAEETGMAGHAGLALTSALSGHPTAAAYHTIKALPIVRGIFKDSNLTIGAQKRIAELLTNPDTTKQAIGMMRRMGATQAQVKSVLRATGAAQGGSIASWSMANPPQNDE